MMEKYGVDLSELPVTDDQLRQLKKVASDMNLSIKMPENRAEADKMLGDIGLKITKESHMKAYRNSNKKLREDEDSFSCEDTEWE